MSMLITTRAASRIDELEPRLRHLLPANLYAETWIDPSADNLTRVFDHLRSLQFTLYGYAPRHVSEDPPQPGQLQYSWEEGTLMFTDLAGFTPLMEANARQGRIGAMALLEVLNVYFTTMIDIIGQAGGILLEFTGDALLAQFRDDARGLDTVRAVRAGLRMQRAMDDFQQIETGYGRYSLRMRIGIHRGRFLTADVGTPLRMEHVLLGDSLLRAKIAEGMGRNGRVCLTSAAQRSVQENFRTESHRNGYHLVIDDLADEDLGEYDFFTGNKRLGRAILLDRSVEGLLGAIENTLHSVEPLATFLPAAVLKLLVEDGSQTQITPDFPEPTILFVNLMGLSEAVDRAATAEIPGLINAVSRLFARINAAVEARGGMLKKVTYNLTGSDIVIYFGALNAHTDDALRAAYTAIEIRQIVAALTLPPVGGQPISLTCQLGLAQGAAFAAEIGRTNGRREFNVLGPHVNLAARLMGKATDGDILMPESVYAAIQMHYRCEPRGEIFFKGRTEPTAVFALLTEAPQHRHPSSDVPSRGNMAFVTPRTKPALKTIMDVL